ncbi:MAG: CD225/dispanin family protein [Coriobacteriales bacterium]|jgi:hypothetical protein|nr:CD225/dispanin family protein [Coriobacteriales bacterium]
MTEQQTPDSYPAPPEPPASGVPVVPGFVSHPIAFDNSSQPLQPPSGQPVVVQSNFGQPPQAPSGQPVPVQSPQPFIPQMQNPQDQILLDQVYPTPLLKEVFSAPPVYQQTAYYPYQPQPYPLPPQQQLQQPAPVQQVFYQQSQYPQQPQGQPGYQMSGKPLANAYVKYLVLSILALLFCSWPFAIPAIVYAVSMNKAYKQGDVTRYLKARTVSRAWLIVSLCVGVVINTFMIVSLINNPGSAPGYFNYW